MMILLWVLCCNVVLLYSVHCQGTPPVISKYGPANLFLEEGHSGILNCTLHQPTSDATVQWFKDGKKIFPAADSRYATNSQNDLIIFSAQNASSSTDGKYRCSATNSFGTTTKEYDLVVKTLLFEEKFLYFPRDTFFYDIDGSRLAWANCQPPKSSPLATITFINGSSLLPVNMNDPRVQIRLIARAGSIFYQLLIQKATKYDVGKWGCQAKHKLGTRTAYFNVSLYGPPKAAMNVRVKEERLNGVVIEWDYLRNDLQFYDLNITPVSNNETRTFRLEEAESFTTQILQYEFVGLLRGENYSIQMRATDKKNQIGSWSKPFVLRTVIELAPIILINPVHTRVSEGVDVTLSCGVQAEPLPTYSWFRNGSLILQNDTKFMSINGGPIGLLVIKNVQRDVDDVSYKCKATNRLGTAVSTAGDVLVEWLDHDFQLKPQNRFFYPSTRFLRVSAKPPKHNGNLRMLWKQGNQSITPLTHPNVKVTQYLDPFGALTHAIDITNPTTRLEDDFEYTVMNLAGIRSAKFSLVQADAPPVITKLNLTSSLAGEAMFSWELPLAQSEIAQLGPQFTYRSDVKSFDIEYKESGSSNVSSISTSGTFVNNKMRTHTVGNLIPGREYQFRIRSVDLGNQVGAWSRFFGYTSGNGSVQNFTTPSPSTTTSYRIHVPQGLVVNNTSNSGGELLWLYKGVISPNLSYFEIQVHLFDNKNLTQQFNTSNALVRSFTLSNLISGSPYAARVRLVSRNQTGNWSEKVFFATAGPKPAISVSASSSTSTAAMISWVLFGDKVSSWKIITKSDDGRTTVVNVGPAVTSFTITGLEPNTTYNVEVLAVLDGIESTAGTITFHTPAGVLNTTESTTVSQSTTRANNVTVTPTPINNTTTPLPRLGGVSNVSVVGKEFEESSAVIIVWSPPTLHHGQDPKLFSYIVEYCELNKLATCMNKTLGSSTSVEISGLKRSNFYQYKVFVFDETNVSGATRDGIYVTANRDTCRSTEFTCGNPQCVSNNRKCNGISDCVDGSDEGVGAGCLPPAQRLTVVSGNAISPTEIKVTWNVINDPSERIRSYVVEIVNSSVQAELLAPVLAPSTRMLSHMFSNLSPDAKYDFRVRAKNPAGLGPWSEVVTVRTLPLVTSSPSTTAITTTDTTTPKPIIPIPHIGVNVSHESAIIFWRYNINPQFPPLRFDVELTPVNNPNETFILRTTKNYIFVTNLPTTGEYRVRVKYVISSDGRGAWSLPSFFNTNGATTTTTTTTTRTTPSTTPRTTFSTTPSTAPDTTPNTTPYQVSTVSHVSVQSILPSAAIISWSADNVPSPNNAHFEIEVQPFGNSNQTIINTVNANIRSAAVSGLVSGSPYRVRIRLVDGNRQGNWSEDFFFATAGPKPPVSVSVDTITPRSAVVNWSAYGDKVSTWKIVGISSNGTQIIASVSPSVSMYALTGLDPNTQYKLNVSAVLNGVEGTPVMVVFTTPDKGLFSTTAATATIPRQITTVTTTMTTPASDLLPGMVPDNVSLSIDISAGRANVQLSWSPPAMLNGNKVEELIYSVKYCFQNTTICNETSRTANTNATLENLRTNVFYSYEIFVYGALGVSGPRRVGFFQAESRGTPGTTPYTTTTQETTTPLIAGPPGIVPNSVSIHSIPNSESSAVTMSWSPPTVLNNNKLNELTYSVKYCILNTIVCEETARISSTNISIDGLDKNAFYSYEIFVYSSRGIQGPERRMGFFKTESRDSCLPSHFACGTSSPFCVPRSTLCNGVNDCSDGSDEKAAAGCAIPAAVTTLKVVNATPSTVTLQWKRLAPQNQVNSYEVENINTREVRTIAPDNPSLGNPDLFTTFMNLQPGVWYGFRIRAVNPTGSGPWSPTVVAITTKARLGKVGDIRNEAKLHQESTARIVSWSAPVDNQGEDPSTFKYLVQYCELNLPDTCRNTSLSSNTNAEITGLKRNTPYSYHIFVFDKDMVAGEVADGVFRTSDRNTCLDTEFTCRNLQCIPSGRNCNGLSECADGTDETTFAGCTPPLTRPSFAEGVATSPRSVKVTWNVIRVPSDRITSYIVENTNTSSQHEVSHPFNVPSITMLSQTFDNLSPNNVHSFRVRAKNPAGLGPFSDVLSVRTPNAGPLGKVGNIRNEAKLHEESTARIVSWSAPVDNNGEDPSTFKYLVQYCELNLPNTCRNKSLSSNTNAEITGLKRNTLYSYHIFVFDKDMVAGEVADGVFRTSNRRTCLNTEFTCRNFQCIPSGRNCNGISDCVDGTDETTFAGCAPPLTRPSIREGVPASAQSVKVTWNVIRVLSDRITSYIVENTNTSGQHEVPHPRNSPATTKLSQTFNNLLSNRAYSFRVRAKNLAGLGPWSDVLTVRTQEAARLGKVGNIRNEAKLHQESTARIVSWSAPVDNNGEDPSTFKYLVQYCELNLPDTCRNTSLSNNTNAELTDLKGNTLYSYHIVVFDKNNVAGEVADGLFRTSSRNTCLDTEFTCSNLQCIPSGRNCNGLSDCADGTDETSFAGCAPPLNRPAFAEGVPTSPRSVKVTWNVIMALSDRITSYIVENTNTSSQHEVPHPRNSPANIKLSQTFNYLLSNRAYSFRVRAKNPAGLGPWSDVLTVRTQQPGRLGKVANIRNEAKLQEEDTARIVSWSAPVDNNGEDPSTFKYLVQYCELNLLDTCRNTSLNNKTYAELTGLKRNTPYSYHIFVFDKDMVAGEVADGVFRTSNRRTCIITEFTCSNLQCIPSGRNCNGLSDCADGTDETSFAGCALPLTRPSFAEGVPTSPQSVKVTWNVIRVLSDRITSYIVENTNTSGQHEVLHPRNSPETTKLSQTFNNLLSNRAYSFRVRAKNPAGLGPWSDVLTVRTQQAGRLGKVGNIKNEAKLNQEDTARIVSWSAPVDNQGEDSSTFKYVVQYCELNLPNTCRNTSLSSNTSAELTGLKRNTPYSYEIFVFNKDMVAGEVADGVFRTSNRRTCLNTEFTCGNLQCIPSGRNCNGLSDCADGTDETSFAGCAPPLTRPSFAEGVPTSPRSVKVTWNVIRVLSDRITFYIVENTNTSGQHEVPHPRNSPETTKLSQTFNNLLSNRAYSFRVRAKNPAGLGPWSDVSTVRTQQAGRLGKVGNIKNEAKLNQESTARIVSWSSPVDNQGEDPSTFKYLVQYCELNLPNTCRNTSLSSNTNAELTGLKRNTPYSYEIFVFNKDMVAGEVADGVFRTSNRRTCLNTEFTCGNLQCIPSGRNCNGLSDCADGTDETSFAGCAPPLTRPSFAEGVATSPQSVKVTWNMIRVLSDRITSYIVENTNTSSQHEVPHPRFSPTVTMLSQTFDNLLSNGAYSFRVRAKNPAGLGPWSDVLTVRTQEAVTTTTPETTTTTPVTTTPQTTTDIITCKGNIVAMRRCRKYGKGNHAHPSNPRFFITCMSGAISSCQRCPAMTVFSDRCKHCVNNLGDKCTVMTTYKPKQTTRPSCPDLCSGKGAGFTKNVVNPNNRKQFIQCVLGRNFGCILCPARLIFREDLNRCDWP